MIDLAIANPNTTIGVLLVIVSVIDYLAGSTPTKKR